MAMGMEVASLYATLGADVSDFQRAMTSAKSDMNGFEKGMSSLSSAVGTGLKVAAGVAVGALGGLAAGIASATSKAAEMQQQMADTQAMMGLTAEEADRLKGLVTELGLDPNLKVSATEAAQAIQVLGTAGLSVDQILQGAAKSTVLLANATGADLAQAGTIASDVMAQFGIRAEDLTGAVDQMSGFVTASKFDINDFQLMLAQAGGVAASVGVSFEDFIAIGTATAPMFASGSDAGTSFKTFLQALVPKSKAAEEAMRALGLITADGANQFFDANGQMKDANEIAELLQNAFSGLSEEQINQAASTIFGTDAMRTAFALAKGGGEEIDRLKGIIGNTSAEESAATRMNTLSGKWEIFQGVIDTVTLGIGDEFLPVAQKLIEWATGMAQKYGPQVIEWAGNLAASLGTVFDWLGEVITTGNLFGDTFDKLPKPIQSVITAVSGFVGGVMTAIDWIGDIIGQFVTWDDVWTAAALIVGTVVVGAIASFIAAIAPVVGIIAGVVAAVALLRTAWENDWGGIKTATNAAKDYLADRFGGLGKTIKEFGGDALSEIKAWAMGQDTEFTATKKIWESAKDSFKTVFADIGAKLKEWGDTAWDEFKTRFPKSAEGLTKAWDTVKQKWDEFWGVLKPAIDKLVEIVKGMVGDWEIGTEDMSSALQTAKDVMDGIWSIMVTAVETNIAVFLDTMKLVIQLLEGDWDGAWQTAKDILGEIWDGMSSIVTTALDTILGAFGTNIEEINGYVEDMETKGKDFWTNFKSGAVDTWTDLSTKLDEWWEKVKKPAADTIADALVTGREYWSQFQTGADVTWEFIKSKLTEWWGIVKGYAEENGPKMLEYGRKYWDEFKSGAMERYEGLRGWLIDRWNELPKPITDFLLKVHGWGVDVIQGFWDGITERWNKFKDWWNGIWPDIQAKMSQWWDFGSPSKWMKQRGEWVVEGFTQGVDSAKAGALNAMDALSSGLTTRANALGVSLEGSLSDIAGRITSLQNYQASLAGLNATIAAQVAAFNFPTNPAPPVSTTPNNTGSYMDTFISQGFNLDTILGNAAQFARDVASWVAHLPLDTNFAAITGPEYRSAYTTLTDNAPDTDNALLNALWALIGSLRNGPNTTQFNLTAAPTQTGNAYTDLSSLVQYLNALYAS